MSSLVNFGSPELIEANTSAKLNSVLKRRKNNMEVVFLICLKNFMAILWPFKIQPLYTKQPVYVSTQ